jgi:hypothetical protein
MAVGINGGFQIPEAEIGNFETKTGENLTLFYRDHQVK